MKILFFSDIHMHNWTQFARTLEGGLNSRLNDQLGVLKQLSDLAIDRAADAIIFCGDMFHSRVRVDVDVLFHTWEMIRGEVAAVVPEMAMLVGNHDQNTKDGAVHSLAPFESIGNVRVISEPCSFKLGTLKVTACPFLEDPKEFTRLAANVEPCDLFLFHQGITEAAVGAFEIVGKGEIPVKALPTDRARLCIGGHYHKHQWVTKNVAYVGSPLQLDFGERTEEKGFLLLDTSTWETEFIPSKAPRFRLFDTVEDFLKARPSERDFVRVLASAEEIEKNREAHPTIQWVAQDRVTKVRDSRIENPEISDRSLLERYINDAEPNTSNRKALLEVGMGLLTEV